MPTNLRIAGFVIGFLIFIVANIMVTAAPGVLNGLLKPLLCPNGEYSSYGGTIQRNGKPRAVRNTECELPNGEKYGVDAQQFGVILVASVVPVVITWLLAWVIGFFQPRRPAPLQGSPSL